MLESGSYSILQIGYDTLLVMHIVALRIHLRKWKSLGSNTFTAWFAGELSQFLKTVTQMFLLSNYCVFYCCSYAALMQFLLVLTRRNAKWRSLRVAIIMNFDLPMHSFDRLRRRFFMPISYIYSFSQHMVSIGSGRSC